MSEGGWSATRPEPPPTYNRLPDGSFSEHRHWPHSVKHLYMQNHPWEMVNAQASAEAYFADHPDMSHEPGLPARTA